MAQYVPGNINGQRVSFSSYSFGAMAITAWGDEWGQRDIVYEMSNGREFEDSQQGPYNVQGE